MLTTRFSLYIIILRIDSEGTFLLHARGFTIRGNSDDKVQIVTIGSADKVRGYYFLSMLYKSYRWYINLSPFLLLFERALRDRTKEILTPPPSPKTSPLQKLK
jgi:hypothetical protein